MMDRRVGPTRRRLRVNTGYKTCRTRRVKCDEAKPTCRNCAKKSRCCRYDDSPAHSSVNLGLRSTHDNLDRFSSSSEHHDPAVSEDSGFRNDPVAHLPPTSPDLASIFFPRGQSPSFIEAANSSPNALNSFHVSGSIRVDENVNGNQFSVAPTNDPLTTEQIPLTSTEVPIFRNYVETVSRWIDSFSRDQPFYSIVPIKALHCPALMNSCLALSAKQLALKSPVEEKHIRENVAIGYYQKAVRAISVLLADSSSTWSDGILASSIILSTYEMLDVAGESFGSHLKGIAFFLQTRQVNGDTKGIGGAAYWTWYRHEIWAALQTGRRMFLEDNYWQPKSLDSFIGLSVEDIANRAIFLFGQCVSFCNHCTSAQGVDSDGKHHDQHDKAVALDVALEKWKKMLPSSMSHFFAEWPSGADSSGSSDFPFLWFIYPQSAIAYQVYHASKILLRLHCPSMPSEHPGKDRIQSLSSRREIERSREQIFLVSNAGVPDTWSLISTQCLFVAGMVTEGVLERHHTLRLIENCQRSSGRRTICLADELRRLWEQ